MAKANNVLYKFASILCKVFFHKLPPGYNFPFGKLTSQKERSLEIR